MEAIKKFLLTISWAMPPAVLPRSIQISRLLKALAERNCETYVLASLINKKKYPTFIFDEALAARYTHKLTTEFVVPNLGTRVRRKLRRSTVSWWEEAVWERASALLRKQKFSALITFGQPFIDHLIGLRLKRDFLSLPWIAHFSDPWVDNPYASPTEDDIKSEREVAEMADALVFTTERTKKLVMRKYPAKWSNKAHILPHCFEPEEVVNIQKCSENCEELHLLHTGNLYAARAPYGLLFALVGLKKMGVSGIKVNFIGHVQPSFHEMIKACALENDVRCLPSMTPAKCLEFCAGADVLLACDAPSPESVFLPSKLVDYLGVHRPIFALTPEASSTTDFLLDVGGLCASPENIDAIMNSLQKLLLMKRMRTLETLLPNETARQKYSAGSTAKLFLQLIESLNQKGDTE